MIEPSMVRAVLEAPCSKAVEKVLSTKYPRAEHLDMFRLCRNYLIFRIIACNCQRSGIIPNMTLSSFERARQKKGGVVMTESRHFILLLHCIKEKVFTIRFKFTIYFQIKKYKTDFVGPAVTALPDPLQEYVQNFLQMVRSLPRYDPAHMSQTSMFLSVRDLTSVPVPLTQSGVNKAINSLWQKVHGRGSKVSATMLRKSIRTHVRRSTLWPATSLQHVRVTGRQRPTGTTTCLTNRTWHYPSQFNLRNDVAEGKTVFITSFVLMLTYLFFLSHKYHFSLMFRM